MSTSLDQFFSTITNIENLLNEGSLNQAFTQITKLEAEYPHPILFVGLKRLHQQKTDLLSNINQAIQAINNTHDLDTIRSYGNYLTALSKVGHTFPQLTEALALFESKIHYEF